MEIDQKQAQLLLEKHGIDTGSDPRSLSEIVKNLGLADLVVEICPVPEET